MIDCATTIPEKVLECQSEGHKVLAVDRGTHWYYACEHCHYALEAHCVDEESVILSTQ